MIEQAGGLLPGIAPVADMATGERHAEHARKAAVGTLLGIGEQGVVLVRRRESAGVVIEIGADLETEDEDEEEEEEDEEEAEGEGEVSV